ncbi:MAG TPA: class II glutamine amidotransferase [Myxococcaceae bacterium]|nr:class II glutamine amidotransferase [Myxococcaceae bacterium]
MCRFYGFRCSGHETVHAPLVAERNSLRRQSLEHPDGWGIAAYVKGPLPEVAHGLGAAHLDPEFERVSGLLQARAVLAHIRLASVGEVSRANAHPFVYGRWTFCHNGTLVDFERSRLELERLIGPKFRRRLEGTTDSERCFGMFLTRLFSRVKEDAHPPVEVVAWALADTMESVARITDRPGQPRSAMNFLVTDGELMLATRRGRTLWMSSEAEVDRPVRGWPAAHQRLHAFQVASENLGGRDVWVEVPEEGVVGVDSAVRFFAAPVPDLAGARA